MLTTPAAANALANAAFGSGHKPRIGTFQIVPADEGSRPTTGPTRRRQEHGAMTGFAVEANFALNIALLLMLVVCGVAIARTRSLLAAILLMGVYSLVSAVWLVVMDAADVAFTEAVVGAGVSTIVLLGAILLARGRTERHDWRMQVVPAHRCRRRRRAAGLCGDGVAGFGDRGLARERACRARLSGADRRRTSACRTW